MGNRKKGTITIGVMKASSPFRYFHFKSGGRYEIGKDINEKVAAWLIRYHKNDWMHEDEEVEGDKAFIVAFANLLSLYKPILEMEEMEDFLPLIEKGFKHEGSSLKIRKVIPRTAEQKAKAAAEKALAALKKIPTEDSTAK